MCHMAANQVKPNQTKMKMLQMQGEHSPSRKIARPSQSHHNDAPDLLWLSCRALELAPSILAAPPTKSCFVNEEYVRVWGQSSQLYSVPFRLDPIRLKVCLFSKHCRGQRNKIAVWREVKMWQMCCGSKVIVPFPKGLILATCGPLYILYATRWSKNCQYYCLRCHIQCNPT